MRVERGDIVKVQAPRPYYGRVSQAGPATFDVRWEDGAKARYDQSYEVIVRVGGRERIQQSNRLHGLGV